MSGLPEGLQVCYSDVSGIGGINFSQTIEQKLSWETFRRVEVDNFETSTARGLGDMTKTYYQFKDNKERMDYKRGLALHVSLIGYSTIIQKY
jgi:hypothetical protein